MKRVIIIADTRDWAFDKIYKALKVNSSKYFIDVWYTQDKNKVKLNHKEYDIVFYLCDYNPEYLINLKIPKKKVILAIRSNVTNEFYNNSTLLENTVSALVVSNTSLFNRFYPKHSNVYLVPGGVDIELFSYQDPTVIIPIRVGWAGSKNNFGKEFRGLDLVESACKNLGYVFNPALREDKWRSEAEMVNYYHKEIDIYVDASIEAGRQNGLLEAGSCGRPIISTTAGIAKELIIHRVNGLIVDRDVRSIESGLREISQNIKEYSLNIRRTIEEMWSWPVHVKKFEVVFDRI